MLNISRTHNRYISIHHPAEWVSLYSKEYNSDGLPRQTSIDWKGSPYKDYGALGGLPDQYYFYADPWIRLTEVRARWLFDVQCLSWRGKRASQLSPSDLRYAKTEWLEYMDDARCFTNQSGTDTHHDYITGRNSTKSDMSYQLLLLGGNRVEVIGETVNLPEKYFNVQQSYPHRLLRTVDIDHLPSPESFLRDPFVCHTPTTIKPTGETGVFPQFDGKAKCVLWSRGGTAYVWEHLIGMKTQ